MAKTLLEQAKKHGAQVQDINKEEINLAIAWAKDEVTLAQVGITLDIASASTYLFLARALREAVRGGRLK